MGLTLIFLFIISALLLLFSISKTYQASRAEQKRIDMAHISVMKEINDMQESIRNIELDIEIAIKEAGIQLSSKELLFMREILDLHKRNYSIESIAEKTKEPVSEIKQLLSPYQTVKGEGRKVAQ